MEVVSFLKLAVLFGCWFWVWVWKKFG